MGIQEKEALIAEIERFKEEAMKSYVVSRWAESYTNTNPFGYGILENENNKVWWMKTQAHQLWEMWKAAKAVPEGFVLVEKSKIRTWYQDDDEPENFCNSESDLDCLGDCLDDDDIIVVNIHESANISTRKVFGVWRSNSPTDIQSKFVLVDSRKEAEEIVASNKAMIEAQEQKG